MARCPFAEWRPLPENRTQPQRRDTAPAIVDHSIVGSAEGAYGYFLNSTSLESHFIVKSNGDIIQLIDTERTADANYQANGFAISIETEDDGNPNEDPWTAAQLDSLARLHDWLGKVHPVPRRACESPSAGGLGYHSMWGAPSAWTPVAGKTCPGTVRIKQWREILLPAFVNGEVSAASGTGGFADMIQRGDKGSTVRAWQRRVNRMLPVRYRIEDDGVYGDATASAFQRALGADAPVDVLGPVLQEKLDTLVMLALIKRTAKVSVDIDAVAREVVAELDVKLVVR